MNQGFVIPSQMVLIIIIGYYFFRPRLPIRLNRAFLAILVIDLCTELFDVVATRMDESWTLHHPVLLWIFNIIYFIFYLTRIYMFYVFSVSVLDARDVGKTHLRPVTSIVYFACCLVALSSPLTGWMFTIQQGYRAGPLYFVLYLCAGYYLLISLVIILRYRKAISRYELISLLAIQAVLLIGNVVRALMPTVLVMNLFSMAAILIIYLSFLNPDLFFSETGKAYNLPAFRAMIAECYRRKRPCRILAFSLQNYNVQREIISVKAMNQLLKNIGRYLVSAFPDQHVFYLHKGFFALVGLNRPDVETMRAQLLQRFAQPWPLENGALRMEISLLEADTEIQDYPPDRLISAILYFQDEMSRVSSQHVVHSLSDSMEDINRKIMIRRCLEKALDTDALEVFLQPLIACKSGKCVAAEALVRLRDDEGKLIRPDLFISLAEREGYIISLGEQVFTKVCRFLRDHGSELPDLQWINVNLSPMQFLSQHIPARFSGLVAQYGIAPERIHLEITEQSMIDFTLMEDQIIELHRAGFQFALDDYGSGYSNLTRVRQYPFTNIKIDMEVVRNYCRDHDLLVPSLIQAFHQMDLTITAEGIETEEMAAAFRKIGCDYLQGYYYSRPVPMEEFLALDLHKEGTA